MDARGNSQEENLGKRTLSSLQKTFQLSLQNTEYLFTKCVTESLLFLFGDQGRSFVIY